MRAYVCAQMTCALLSQRACGCRRACVLCAFVGSLWSSVVNKINKIVVTPLPQSYFSCICGLFEGHCRQIIIEVWSSWRANEVKIHRHETFKVVARASGEVGELKREIAWQENGPSAKHGERRIWRANEGRAKEVSLYLKFKNLRKIVGLSL